MRRAFTLLEVIFTIVILSIIGVISAQIISKLYEEYITTRAINELESRTETTLETIARRLDYRVKEATIARDEDNETNITSLSNANEDYEILEWIGYDVDSFNGNYDSAKGFMVPGWSGFVDLYSSDTNETQIKTPGSELNITDSFENSITQGKVNLHNGKAGLIFKGLPYGYDVKQFGWNCFNEPNPTHCINRNYIYDVNCSKNDCSEPILKVSPSLKGKEITEQYYITYSAYAIVPKNNNLYLYYNYRPWHGDRYSDGEKTLLAKNVSTFKFRQIDQVIRLKLCMYKKITDDYNLSFCKEKVVY